MKPPDAVNRCARAVVLALFCCLLFVRAASASLLLARPAAGSIPDLLITKTHSGVFYHGQQNAMFTITITNVSDVRYTGGVKVSDTLPQGLIYKSFFDPFGVWNCSSYPVERRVDCVRSISLAPGASSSFDLYTVVQAGAPPTMTNLIDLTSSADMNPDNNHAEDTALVLSGPDLAMAVTGPNTIREGQKDVSYTFTVTNNGNGPTAGPVTVSAALPAGLIARSLGGEGWTCNFSTRVCVRSDPLPVSRSYPGLIFIVDVPQDAPPQVETRADVTVERDIDPANNAASLMINVVQAPDLTVSVLHNGDFRQGQADAFYRLWVTNIDAGVTISPVTVTDFLPDGFAAVSMEGSGWDCSVEQVSCTYKGEIVSQASSPEILLGVRVAEDAPPLVTNVASVSGGGEFNTANNSAKDETKIVQIPDLTITKTHSGNFYQGQQGAQYTITVSNVGAGPVFGSVLVQEILPQDHPTWLEITGLAGLGWACDIAHETYTCMREDDTGLLPGGSYPPITVTVNVLEEMYVLRLTNTAVVSGGGERNTTNNRAEDDTIILPDVDLALHVSHDGPFAQGQQGAEYRLDVMIEGSYPAQPPVTVTSTLPPGLTAKGMRGEGWQCTLSTLTCTYSGVPGAGETAYPSITLTVDVAANAPPVVAHRAQVTTAGDIDPSDDIAVDETAISPVPDLTLGIQHSGVLVRGKAGSTFALTVTNQGGQTTNLVSITYTLPDGLIATGISGEGWSCVQASLSCTRADLLHGGFSYPPVLVEVGALSNAPAQVTFRAAVSGSGEGNTANNSAALTVPVYTAPTVLQHPQDTPGCIGLPIAFRAHAEGVPVPAVQWQFSSDGGVTWNDLQGSTEEELRFTLLSIHTDKRYRAVFRSAAGEVVTRSAAVGLHEPLGFAPHPADQTVEPGQPATFWVEITGSPLQSLLWQISRDGAAWEAFPESSGKTLTFTPRLEMDGWQVRAAAINACGVFPSQPARINVARKPTYLPMLSR